MKEMLHRKRSFTYKYRIMVAGVPRYFQFSVMRVNEGKNFVLCVKDIQEEIDAEQERIEKQKKSFSFSQIAESLASNYDVIYYVDIADSSYVGYTSKNIYGHMEVQEEGSDFYQDSAVNLPKLVHPDDQERILHVLAKDYLITSLGEQKNLSVDYRLLINGEPQFTRLNIRKSSDDSHFIIGVENIDNGVDYLPFAIAVFIRGDDYRDREALTAGFKEQVHKNLASGEGPVVAIGMTTFEPGKDHKVFEIFDRADSLMYENKRHLKDGI